jgi:hypothetical protein
VTRVRLERAARIVAVGSVCAAAVIGSVLAGAQDKPLPDKATFVEEARRRLKSDEQLQRRHTYRERQLREDFDSGGRVEKRVTREFEVYPSVEGSPSYRRLIAVNGVPEPEARLADADRKQRGKLREWARERQSESPSARARRESKEKRDQAHRARIIDDIQRVYDIRMDGREALRGRPAIVLTLTPRPGVRPLEDDSAPMTSLSVKAWIDEDEREVVRAEVEATDAINVGFGLLARIAKGTTLAFDRQRTNGEGWLPSRMEVRPKARIALLKSVDAHIVSEYSDYRPFTVETALDLARSKPDK